MDTGEVEKIRSTRVSHKRQMQANKDNLERKDNGGMQKRLNRKGALKRFYAPYLRSSAWALRCQNFYAQYGCFCRICGRTDRVTMHHMSYKHLGDERDEELMPLCPTHHKDYHRLNGVQTNMIKKTHAYIKAEKEEHARKKAQAQALGTVQTTHTP